MCTFKNAIFFVSFHTDLVQLTHLPAYTNVVNYNVEYYMYRYVAMRYVAFL